MNKHISKILFCFLFTFSLQHLACQAQKKWAKEIIGTWIAQEFQMETQNGSTNLSDRETAMIKNRIAFLFMKGGKFEAKTTQGTLETIKGTWRMEKDVLLLTSDNKNFEQDMGRLRVKIANGMLRLGILSESSMTPASHMMVFVCKKGNMTELLTTPIPYDKEPAVKPQLVTSYLETFVVDAQEGDCEGKPCLRVKRDGATAWENFEPNIEDFTYEKGHEYLLNVNVTIVEISSETNTEQIVSKTTTYKLSQLMSKTKK
jgi:hypothetical protein